MQIKIFKDNEAVAVAFARYFAEWLQDKESVTVALSGGSTPKVLFKHWAKNYREKISWEKIHFFWGDERCVPPDHPESNYGLTKKLLFDHITIPEENIHRIRGEEPPEKEVGRYEEEIRQSVRTEDGLPLFDLIILGMGADGHTASIFPNQMDLLTNLRICSLATHPNSGQKRISLTGKVINKAQLATFLVTGRSKSPVIKEIMTKTGRWSSYPAAFIAPDQGELVWFLDTEASAELS